MKILLISIIISISLCSLPKFNVSSITVSGLSSGAFMAAQLHVIHSSNIKGAGVVAGGPFFCSQGTLQGALTNCMYVPTMINVEILLNKAKSFDSDGKIDPLSNIQNQPVYLYSGSKDTTVNPGVVQKAEQMYKALGANLATKYDIPSAHGQPTVDFGNNCGTQASPYIQKCQYSGAENILSHLLAKTLNAPGDFQESNLVKFDQSSYFATGSSMGDTGYYYVPTACKSQTCDLHIVFHGCQQTIADIGTEYITKTEYVNYAETNNIILLFPQAKKSTFMPQNPQGCFDFWGYSDDGLMPLAKEKFATKDGKQISGIWKMITELSGVQ